MLQLMLSVTFVIVALSGVMAGFVGPSVVAPSVVAPSVVAASVVAPSVVAPHWNNFFCFRCFIFLF